MKSEDIAKLAGVSRSTVSRVVNNYSNVPPETREKVLSIIKQYNYEPNTSARVLAGKGINTIGLFIVSIAEKDNANRIYKNPYFSSFIDAAVDTANVNGFYVLIHTIYTKEDYQRVRQAFQQKRIDGGIIVGTEKDLDSELDISKMDCPLVVLDYDAAKLQTISSSSRCCVINAADFDGSMKALEYLYDLGHREIAIITGRLSTFSGKERFRAYQHFLKKNNLKYDKSFILHGRFLKHSASLQIQKLIKGGKLPTALFCCNDEMAVAAMEVFHNEGVRIPEDISVIGFDDTPAASVVKPSLTTVQVPIDEMAKKAVNSLLQLVESEGSAFQLLTFPITFIERESCNKPANLISST